LIGPLPDIADQKDAHMMSTVPTVRAPKRMVRAGEKGRAADGAEFIVDPECGVAGGDEGGQIGCTAYAR